ncbi:MAG: helix-turn-helix transcriptional regulator [Parcubacteria group bacterium]|nr:helix-turn-helix transcriptional regulator [Parcubacteria group bacterium]
MCLNVWLLPPCRRDASTTQRNEIIGKKTTRVPAKGKTAKAGRRQCGEWTIADIDDLEGWREQRRIHKKEMARMLGVTNSTYHNWLRGISVATPSTQRRIKLLMESNGSATMVPTTARSSQDAADRDAIARTVGTIMAAYVEADTNLTVDQLVGTIRRVRQELAA